MLAALVVFLFLRDWRSTLIAAVAMPLSLIPTFVAMALFGFSLNLLTLLALTLVIGILVDDAIVEIENIQKRVERGLTPFRAALIGGDAIGLAVVATTFSIVVVFAPVSFMPGVRRPVLSGIRHDGGRVGAVLTGRGAAPDAAARRLLPQGRARSQPHAAAPGSRPGAGVDAATPVDVAAGGHRDLRRLARGGGDAALGLHAARRQRLLPAHRPRLARSRARDHGAHPGGAHAPPARAPRRGTRLRGGRRRSERRRPARRNRAGRAAGGSREEDQRGQSGAATHSARRARRTDRDAGRPRGQRGGRRDRARERRSRSTRGGRAAPPARDP